MKKVLGALVFGAILVTIAVPVFAKGPTIKLTINGPSLGSPVVVTNKEAIFATVWGGEFVNWGAGSVAAPSSELARYTVQFHVLPPRSEVKMLYVVTYVWDAAAQRALVHLPGRGEEWYRLNVSTILRDGYDGKWFYASDTWGRAIRQALP